MILILAYVEQYTLFFARVYFAILFAGGCVNNEKAPTRYTDISSYKHVNAGCKKLQQAPADRSANK